MKRAYCSEVKHFPDQVVAFADNPSQGGSQVTYKRKTRDEYEVQGNYGYGDGWECVTTEDNWRGAKDRIKEYRANEPGVPFRIKMVRVKIEVAEAVAANVKCEACDGTGVSVCVDWVPYGMGNAALESEEYCGNCLMSGDDGAGKCPNCGGVIRWNDGAELFETCDKCGFTDPFNKGA